MRDHEQRLARRRAWAGWHQERRAARDAAGRDRVEVRVTRRESDRQARHVRWAARRQALQETMRSLRPVVPLGLVTGFAMFGQIAYGVDAYSPPEWAFVLRLLIAVGAAVAVESIALYVSWHAHDALLMKATATAARLRRASYAIALGVAGINYAHFADGWTPTPAAVVFALFSASSPWLWGLHTRRAEHEQLIREGNVDSVGAVFSSERYRAFPIRTFLARRWSIDHGVVDPREAWEGYRAVHEQRLADRRQRRLAGRGQGRTSLWTGLRTARGDHAGQATDSAGHALADSTEQAPDSSTDRPADSAADSRSVIEPTPSRAPRTGRTRPVRKSGRGLRSVAPDRSVDFADWVRELGEIPAGNVIRSRYGCGYDVAERIVREYRQAQPQANEGADDEDRERAV